MRVPTLKRVQKNSQTPLQTQPRCWHPRPLKVAEEEAEAVAAQDELKMQVETDVEAEVETAAVEPHTTVSVNGMGGLGLEEEMEKEMGMRMRVQRVSASLGVARLHFTTPSARPAQPCGSATRLPLHLWR